MRVAVQQYVHVLRRLVGRDVDEPEPDTVSFKINQERPVRLVVAIAPNNGYWRSDHLYLLEKTWRADVPEVPDFIHTCGQFLELWRKVIVRIRDHQNPDSLCHADLRTKVVTLHNSR